MSIRISSQVASVCNKIKWNKLSVLIFSPYNRNIETLSDSFYVID